uniref:Pilus formation protein N-terminal domain-containing protein n=1 Tax=Marinobacter nauticus TaxID=2743 RepID=A0A455W1E4_MARNT|nr:hypothetical protein YBY_04290 [Marinobacter nauticus]
MKCRSFVFALVLFSLSGSVLADTLGDLSVVTLSPGDGKAVIKNPSGKLSVVAIGESIGDTPYVVRQVLSGKLLVKDSGERGMGSLTWLHLSRSGAPSRVEVIREVEPKPAAFSVPGNSEL